MEEEEPEGSTLLSGKGGTRRLNAGGLVILFLVFLFSIVFVFIRRLDMPFRWTNKGIESFL